MLDMTKIEIGCRRIPIETCQQGSRHELVIPLLARYGWLCVVPNWLRMILETDANYSQGLLICIGHSQGYVLFELSCRLELVEDDLDEDLLIILSSKLVSGHTGIMSNVVYLFEKPPQKSVSSLTKGIPA
jgi:hypothetical protein